MFYNSNEFFTEVGDPLCSIDSCKLEDSCGSNTLASIFSYDDVTKMVTVKINEVNGYN